MSWLVNRIRAFAYRNYLFAVKNVFTFMEILFWPLVAIISIGIMMTFLEVKQEYIFFILTGAVVGGVLQVAQLDVAYGLLYDVWSKSVKQTFIAPVRSHDFIIGSWLFGIARGMIAFVMLYYISKWSFGFEIPDIGIVVISLSGVFLSSLITGMIVIFVIFNFGQRIDVIAWMIAYLMMLVCGVYYPVTIMPGFVVKIAQFLPLTYFLEYFRTGYGFALNFTHPLIKGYLLSFSYVAFMYLMINKAYNRSRRTGMILKLSE